MDIGHLGPVPRNDFTARLTLWDRPSVEWAGEGLNGLFGIRGPEDPAPVYQGELQVTFEPFEADERPRGVQNVVLQLAGSQPSQAIGTLPWARLLRAAEALVIAQRRNSVQDWLDTAQVAAEATGERVYRRPKPRGRKPLGHEHYERIAQRYQQLCAAGVRAPVAAIAKEEAVNSNTARAWVNRARKRGLLGPASNGRAG